MTLNGGTKQMTEDDRTKIMKSVSNIASKGLRCLAIAEIPNAGTLSHLTDANKN
jgi:hypothetical protein